MNNISSKFEIVQNVISQQIFWDLVMVVGGKQSKGWYHKMAPHTFHSSPHACLVPMVARQTKEKGPRNTRGSSWARTGRRKPKLDNSSLCSFKKRKEKKNNRRVMLASLLTTTRDNSVTHFILKKIQMGWWTPFVLRELWCTISCNGHIMRIFQ